MHERRHASVSGTAYASTTGKTGVAAWRHHPLAARGSIMAGRKTDPEPFPVRGTPSGYRDRWDADDSAIIQALNAERERLISAVRESAAPFRRGKGRVPGESCQPGSPADRIVTEP
jgi:hypothetical protein